MTTESQENYNIKESDEISLKELILKIQEWWHYLLSKWLIILIFGLIGGALGFWYATTKNPVYTATTTFVLEDEKGGGLGNLAGLASMAGVDLGGSGGGIFQGDNILDLYKSRNMIEKTLLSKVKFDNSNLLLIDRYIQSNKLRELWLKKPELLKLNFTPDSVAEGFPILKPNRLRDSVIREVVEDINKNYLNVAKPDKKLSKIQVDVKSKDEIFAKNFNDILVKNVNEFYVNTKTKKTLNNVRILQHKTDSVRAVMNGAIYTAVAVADATPNLNPTRQVQRVAPAQRAQFSAESNKAIYTELVKNLEMTKMSLLKETPLLEVVDSPIYPLKKEKFGKLKGIVFGGVFSGFFIVAILIFRKLFKLVMQ
jgi:hypothetical protein